MTLSLFALLSLLIVLATAISTLMRLLRQPLIIGYILTGVLVGPSLLNVIPDQAPFQAFSSIGIALLLFIIGLGLNTEVIKRLGRVVLVTALVQIGLSIAVGYGVAMLFGFSPTEALITGVALSFSSTIIIIKLFTDKREQNRLYAQISLGILLLQDLVATIALVVLAAAKSGELSLSDIGLLSLKGLIAGTLVFLVGTKLLPKIAHFIASSQEFLFLFALAWGFGIATLFEQTGFSIEVGALFAGVSLASLPYAQEVAARLKPLRDFFVVVFFMALGESLQLGNFTAVLWPAVAFSIAVIIIKPLIVLGTMGLFGYTKRTSFKTALSLSQISEFSLVFIILAVSTGLASNQLRTAITLVAMLSIAISTYLMKYDDRLYVKLQHRLRLFERKTTRDEHHHLETYPLILLGYRKGGEQFVKSFKALRRRYVVVDYDPEVIDELEHSQTEHLYGDVTDPELLQELNIEKSKLIISTITDQPTTLNLVRHIVDINPDAIIICHSDDYKHAAELYHLGATYVMMPHLIGSEKISTFIKRAGLDKKQFVEYRRDHLLLLEERN